MVSKALDSLRSENDIVVIEGAGSPSEINIAKYDIANMLLAQEVSAPVIIVADIERWLFCKHCRHCTTVKASTQGTG